MDSGPPKPLSHHALPGRRQEGARGIRVSWRVLWAQEKVNSPPGAVSSLLRAMDAPPYLASSLAHGSIHHPWQGQDEQLDHGESAWG